MPVLGRDECLWEVLPHRSPFLGSCIAEKRGEALVAYLIDVIEVDVDRLVGFLKDVSQVFTNALYDVPM